jgi:hypothetical protein
MLVYTMASMVTVEREMAKSLSAQQHQPHLMPPNSTRPFPNHHVTSIITMVLLRPSMHCPLCDSECAPPLNVPNIHS